MKTQPRQHISNNYNTYTVVTSPVHIGSKISYELTIRVIRSSMYTYATGRAWSVTQIFVSISTSEIFRDYTSECVYSFLTDGFDFWISIQVAFQRCPYLNMDKQGASKFWFINHVYDQSRIWYSLLRIYKIWCSDQYFLPFGHLCACTAV